MKPVNFTSFNILSAFKYCNSILYLQFLHSILLLIQIMNTAITNISVVFQSYGEPK